MSGLPSAVGNPPESLNAGRIGSRWSRSIFQTDVAGFFIDSPASPPGLVVVVDTITIGGVNVSAAVSTHGVIELTVPGSATPDPSSFWRVNWALTAVAGDKYVLWADPSIRPVIAPSTARLRFSFVVGSGGLTRWSLNFGGYFAS